MVSIDTNLFVYAQNTGCVLQVDRIYIIGGHYCPVINLITATV